MIEHENTDKQCQQIHKPIGRNLSITKQRCRCRLQPINARWLFGAQFILKADGDIIT